MAHLYFAEQLSDAAFARDSFIEVSGDEARHAVRVSRLRVGEEILVGNGTGTLGRGTVDSVSRDRFTVHLADVWREPVPTQRLVLVQALAKGDRDERAVEQATEFGVDAVVPWQADRSVSRWDGAGPDSAAKVARGLAKWSRIAREAAKQSLRPTVPEVRDPMTLDGLCGLAAEPGSRAIVLHPRGIEPLSAWTRAALGPDDDIDTYVVVGPEGGFSDAEVRRLEGSGAHVLSLGRHVLRTSSAGPAALAVLNVALGRW